MNEISLGNATSATITGHTTPDAVIRDIQAGRWAQEISALRAATGEDAARLKRKLPAVLWSGKFSGRSNKGLIQRSGLICADLDKIPERVGELHDIARNDPHVVAAFVSPSGNGLKIVFRADEFAAVRAHVAEHYGAAVDEAAKDVARLCFVSHDPAAFYNPDVLPLEVSQPDVAPDVIEVGPATNIEPSSRAQIAERILGPITWSDDGGFCKCPGQHLHTTGNGERDCIVKLDGAPTIKCFHASCAGIVEGVNHSLRSQIGKAERAATTVAGLSVPISDCASNPSESPDPNNHFKSDVGYGDAFVARHADSVRYCADEKFWLVFNEAHGWQRDETGTKIKSMAADYARELYKEALVKASELDPDSGKRVIANAAALGNQKRIKPALEVAASNPAVVVRSDELDADPQLVGVLNGVVNLADGSFQSHRRDHLVTRRLAVHYDSTAFAPHWEKFLVEVQPDLEMRCFLQRLCGYSISGEVREHVLPFHYGTGANGKGTFLEHGVLKLAGNYGAKLTDSLVYASDRGSLPHLELANLCGKRFALGEENSESGRLNEALLKSITGGDRQKGRFHYGNFIEYFPTYKIALVGNHKPRIDGTDDGIWRRFLLVDWKVQIPEDKRDPSLKDKLAAEMPGILNWCIEGAIAWRTSGLNPPASCMAATAEFRVNSDKLADFISENFIADPSTYCTKADVFSAYQDWADRQGINYPMSKRALGVQLINRGWQEFRQGHEKLHSWAGFRLKTTTDL